MQVKRYEASNIKEILVKIKKDLGPDAIVLSTRQLPGVTGRIEVLAAIDRGFVKKDSPAAMDDDLLKGYGNEDEKETTLSLKEEITRIKALLRGAELGKIEAALAGMNERMDALMGLSTVAWGPQDGVWRDLYFRFIERGLSRASAARLLSDVRLFHDNGKPSGFEQVLKTAGASIRRVFAEKKEKESRIKVFLGPTGVGKTTTLAKIAARYALRQKKSVALITADTYRIGAVEQLKTYAQIIDLPIEVADSKEAIHRSLMRFSDKDCVFVDTPGRGGDSGEYLSDLREMFPGEAELEANLLLSPATSRESMMDVITRFEAFGVDQIIFTKIDECRRFGVLYDVVESIGKSVSYLANGQNVPQDIEKATPDRLTDLVIGT